MTDSEDATDTLAETLAALVYLAAKDGLDASTANAGSWSIADDGSATFKAGKYSGSFTGDQIAKVLTEEEQEEPPAPDDEAAEPPK